LGGSEAVAAGFSAAGARITKGIPFGQAYTAARDVQDRETAARHSPLNDGAGWLGGGASLLYGGAEAKGALGAVKSGKIVAGLARGAKVGAAYGAAGMAADAHRVEDIPGHAALGAGVGAALGAAGEGVLGLARGARAVTKLSPEQASRAAAFRTAKVRPTLVALRGEGTASVAKAIAENPIAGPRVRGHLAASIADTGKAADRLANVAGTPQTRGAAGETIQGGIRDFDQRFSTRAGRMYDKAFATIHEGQANAVDQAQNKADFANPRANPNDPLWFTHDAPSAAPVIHPKATADLLGDLSHRANASDLNAIITDPRFGKLAGALKNGSADLRFNDLRNLRTWTREAQASPELRQGISAASLQRLEGSLTTDIHDNAARLAGPIAARRLQQADKFYSIGSKRIQGALQDFLGKANPKSGESAYDLLQRTLSDKGGADTAKALALKKSLTPAQWGDVQATMISRMGKVADGSPEAMDPKGFSVHNFLTNYAKLSPQGREILHGNLGSRDPSAGALRPALDNLARVAGYQKGVEKAANSSKSAVGGQIIATGAGLLTPHATLPTAAGLAGGAGLGEALTNPRFVNWLAREEPGGAKAAKGAAVALKSIGESHTAVKAIQHHFVPYLTSRIGAAGERQATPDASDSSAP
jgi:hypothetical protein